MNIFEKALKEDFKLPSEYIISMNRKIKIKVSYIVEIKVNVNIYIDHAYGTDFENRNDFEMFIYNNFKSIDKIKTIRAGKVSEYYLNNGLLNNYKNPSIIDNVERFFIKGREFKESDFYKYIRNEKINNLI